MPGRQLAVNATEPEAPEQTMTTDEELILEFQQGSSQAFEELFRRYLQPIYGFFRRRLNDMARAEELAQETFLAVIRGRERYEPRALVRTYLYGIALKQLAAERRRKVRSDTRPAVEATDSHNPDAAMWVGEALEKLDAQSREVVMLREYEQLSYEEIALLLSIPINTVRSRLFRARMELKSLLLSRNRAF
ncbi:MAG: sigma-70 family RNA polymerase sigma factor [Terriglobia bacterium]|jgi:RNA polymerase sigma-70 factor (ECF subfamily)